MKNKFNFFVFLIFIAVGLNCKNAKNISGSNHISESQLPLRDTYWKLYALMRNKIPGSDSSYNKEAFLILKKDGSSSGNGGCNTFGGSYETNDSSQIKFGPIISTKIYCENGKLENLFFDILSKTDNYLIEKDTLFLRNKTLDSTAKLIAVPLKKIFNNYLILSEAERALSAEKVETGGALTAALWGFVVTAPAP